MRSKNANPLILVCVVYQLWMLIQGNSSSVLRTSNLLSCHSGTSLASLFTHELHNLTIVYKPDAYIYHFCQIAPSIPAKRIRWHYETSHHSNHETLTHCKHLLNNSECFDFYYGPSLSLLVVKEPDLFVGKYSCHVNVNSTYELNSTGWIEVKSLSSDHNGSEESTTVSSTNDLQTLAGDYDVPLIVDENQFTSFGKRVPSGGIFHTTCQSVESSHPISFLWLQLRNSSKGMKTVRFVHDDGRRVRIKNDNGSSKSSRTKSGRSCSNVPHRLFFSTHPL